MSTFKTALLIIWRHKSYFLVYLVGMSLITLFVGYGSMSQAVEATKESSVGTFKPVRAKVSVINRDSGDSLGRDLGQGLTDYLSGSADMVSLPDENQTMQDALANGDKTDLIIIIPQGFSQRFLKACAVASVGAKSVSVPKVQTATNYKSSHGDLAQVQVDSYFDGVRVALLGGLGQSTGDAEMDTEAMSDTANMVDMANAASSNPSAVASTTSQGAQMSSRGNVRPITVDARAFKAASDYTVKHFANNQAKIIVQTSPRKETKTLSAGFAQTVSLASYPLMTALTVCLALLFGSFSMAEQHRRLMASPIHNFSLNLQQFLAALLFGLVAWAYFTVLILGLTVVVGGNPESLGWGRIGISLLTMMIFVVAASAFGYMLSQFNLSNTVINAVAIIMGLVIMFTSGSAMPIDMPTAMTLVGKLTPGWWYNSAVNAVFGLSPSGKTVSAGVFSAANWSTPALIVLLFALLYFCVGLMVGRLRRSGASIRSVTS